MGGGGGEAVRDTAHIGSGYYNHYHALDYHGNRMPGHFAYGGPMSGATPGLVDPCGAGEGDGLSPDELYEAMDPFADFEDLFDVSLPGFRDGMELLYPSYGMPGGGA